jgi:hypothetical protein
MQLLHTIKQVAHGPGGVHDLTEDDAYQLFSAMLDAGLPDLELGALLIALRLKGESVSELLGFHRAVCERLYPMQLPDSATRPLVIPAYGGARHEANLLPLLGLLLKRLGVPVVFHGMLEGSGRVAAVYILREFGVLPSASLPHAQAQLEQEHIAFVPDAVLCPGLAALLALRNRLGVRNSAHVVGKLIDPFSGAGVLMAGAASAPSSSRPAPRRSCSAAPRASRSPIPAGGPASITSTRANGVSCSTRRPARSSRWRACRAPSTRTRPPSGCVMPCWAKCRSRTRWSTSSRAVSMRAAIPTT